MKKFYNIAKNSLFPINRSLTGEGVLKTLKIIKKEFPLLKIIKVKSRTKVFDWKVPDEWRVKEAYVQDMMGEKIIDFKNHNLHIVGYSMPVIKMLKKDQLLQKLHYIKNQPNAIPYITSYYKRSWGFCLSYNDLKSIDKKYNSNDSFKVVIKSSFKKNGFLNYGELVLKGSSKKEILISTYICHPSMANNELSGPTVAMGLIDYFRKKKLKKTLRFLFIPETIGSIVFIHKNLNKLKRNTIGGFNLTCIGDERNHSCMLSKYKNSPSDEAIVEAYKKLNIKNYKIFSFLDRGSDERQFNSPGVDIPVSSIFRTKYHEYPEYHTSLDNFNLVTLKGIIGGFNVSKEAIQIMQDNIYPKFKVLCEPQISKRGLYPSLSTKKERGLGKKYLDFLQYSDGTNSLKELAKLIELDYCDVKKINDVLLKKKLISN